MVDPDIESECAGCWSFVMIRDGGDDLYECTLYKIGSVKVSKGGTHYF